MALHAAHVELEHRIEDAAQRTAEAEGFRLLHADRRHPRLRLDELPRNGNGRYEHSRKHPFLHFFFHDDDPLRFCFFLTF